MAAGDAGDGRAPQGRWALDGPAAGALSLQDDHNATVDYSQATHLHTRTTNPTNLYFPPSLLSMNITPTSRAFFV